MAGTKKMNKSKPRNREPAFPGFGALADDTGNPRNPKEFDDSPHDEDEKFFQVDEDTTEVEKGRVPILNAIHKGLHHNTIRVIPALDVRNDNPNIDIYHHLEFEGVTYQVGVLFPPREDGDFKQCLAFVKVASDSWGSSDTVIIDGDAAWNADSKKDKFTLKNDKITANYWVPRWKYIVNILRTLAYEGYEINGVKKPEPEVVANIDKPDNNGPDDSPEDGEELFSIFAGCAGKIIGPKGAKIQEIKRLSGVKDIKMPAKDEDAPRLRARDPAEITLTGKVRAIEKAKTLIQEVVDEWANAPRPPRDGGGYQAQNDAQPDGGETYGTDEEVAMSGDWGGGETTKAAAEGGGADAGGW